MLFGVAGGIAGKINWDSTKSLITCICLQGEMFVGIIMFQYRYTGDLLLYSFKCLNVFWVPSG